MFSAGFFLKIEGQIYNINDYISFTSAGVEVIQDVQYDEKKKPIADGQILEIPQCYLANYNHTQNIIENQIINFSSTQYPNVVYVKILKPNKWQYSEIE